MKVRVNIINTRCIIMSEAVTVPSLTMMTSTVSEASLARDTQTHRLGSSKLKFANKKRQAHERILVGEKHKELINHESASRSTVKRSWLHSSSRIHSGACMRACRTPDIRQIELGSGIQIQQGKVF